MIATVTTAENASTTKATPARKVTPFGKKILGKGSLNSKGKVTVVVIGSADPLLPDRAPAVARLGCRAIEFRS